MKISVIGTGYVGLVTGVVFANLGHDVICMDKNEEKIEKLKNGIMPIYEPGLEEMANKNYREGRLYYTVSIKEAVENSEIIFIAVDTMPKKDWETDLSSVKNVARDIGKYINSYKIIVNKSTVPVGTGDLVEKIIKKNMKKNIPFDIVSNPEFLREGAAINDTLHPDRIIIGAKSVKAATRIVELYQEMNSVIKITKLKSAELIKYASNSFLGMKISFINSIADIAELTDADITEIAEGIGLDRRIGKEFLNAGIGYGGSCFPKDIGSLIYTSKSLRYDFGILKEVKKVNELRVKRFVEKIESKVKLSKKRVSILGLSFKPNTDDIREAPSLKLIKFLMKKKCEIKVFDPKAMENVKKVFGNSILYSKDVYDCVSQADVVILVTEWEIFKNVDLKKIKNLMQDKYFFDGRNVYDPEIMKNLGFEYYSVGR